MKKEGHYLKDGVWMPERRSGEDRRRDRRGGRRETDSQEPRYLAEKNCVTKTQETFESQRVAMLFDYEKGLALCDGDYRIYERMLHSFLERVSTVLDCVHEHSWIDFSVYQNLIRLIRLDLEMILAPRLAAMAQVLEKAAKHGNCAILEEDHDIFVALIYLLCSEVRMVAVGLATRTGMADACAAAAY